MEVSKRNRFIILLTGMFFIFVSFAILYFNIPLRTAIFRSFAKGNWYITSEADTLYTFGYYGVRRYVPVASNGLEIIARNNDFCTNTNIARGGCIYKDYLYVTARSYLGGQQEKDGAGYINGALLILTKRDLKEVKKVPSDIKLVEAKVHDHNLIVSGLGGFEIYDITNPEEPDMIFRYRHPSWREYHGFDFFEVKGHTYVAFALFTGGIEIWDMTDPAKTLLKAHVPLSTPTAGGAMLSDILQTLHVLADYPYLYAPLAPSRAAYNGEEERRGVLAYDVSNLDSIRVNVSLIPGHDWYRKSTGDLAPSFIDKHHSTIYTNFGEKGVAMFDIARPFVPQYVKTQDVTGCNALIQPIHITSTDWLYAGSYYWSDMYGYKLSE